MSSNGRGSYGYPKPRDSGRSDTAPYVHPSRQQTVPTSVDLSAPVIHFGTSREAAPRQSLKDQHFARAQDEKTQAFLTPATKEQKLYTLFIGGLIDDFDDYWMERLLNAAAKLKQWKRATDGTGRKCPFGFAEYDGPDNVKRACMLLTDVKIPDRGTDAARRQLIVSQDETSKAYVEDYLAAKDSKGNEAKERNMVLSASGQMERVVKDFLNPDFKKQDGSENKSGKGAKKASSAVDESKAVTIMLSIEDELGDIPEEQRESIAKEITSFRDRSAKRDQERARQIAEEEARRLEFERASRQALRGKVATGDQATEEIAMIRRVKKSNVPFEEENLSEQEICQKRAERQERDAEIQYIEEERKWTTREASRIAAFNRDATRLQQESARQLLEQKKLAEKLATFDDDKEMLRNVEEFYRDRSAWVRARILARGREIEADQQDRLDEQRELDSARKAAMRDSATDTTEPDTKRAQPTEEGVAPLKLSLAKKADELRKPVMNSEVILEDDEDETVTKRVLVPLHYQDETTATDDQEERQARLRSIVEAIPTGKDQLWSYEVKWSLLNETMLQKIRDFVCKKIIEAIGMEEEDLIAFIMRKVREHGKPGEIVQELVSAIGDEEESELLTVKIWRYLLILIATASV